MYESVKFLFFEVTGRMLPVMFPFLMDGMPKELVKQLMEDKELIVRYSPSKGHIEIGYEGAGDWVMSREGSKPAPAVARNMEFSVAQVPFYALFDDKAIQDKFGYDVDDLWRQAKRLNLDINNPDLMTRIIPQLKIIEVGQVGSKWAIGVKGLEISKLPRGLNPCNSYTLFIRQDT